MTIPEHIREEAERLSSNWAMPECEEPCAFATALLAAEQRGMKRAAGIADRIASEWEQSEQAKISIMGRGAPSYRAFSASACEGVAAAIRKAREELK